MICNWTLEGHGWSLWMLILCAVCPNHCQWKLISSSTCKDQETKLDSPWQKKRLRTKQTEISVASPCLSSRLFSCRWLKSKLFKHQWCQSPETKETRITHKKKQLTEGGSGRWLHLAGQRLGLGEEQSGWTGQWPRPRRPSSAPSRAVWGLLVLWPSRWAGPSCSHWAALVRKILHLPLRHNNWKTVLMNQNEPVCFLGKNNPTFSACGCPPSPAKKYVCVPSNFGVYKRDQTRQWQCNSVWIYFFILKLQQFCNPSIFGAAMASIRWYVCRNQTFLMIYNQTNKVMGCEVSVVERSTSSMICNGTNLGVQSGKYMWFKWMVLVTGVDLGCTKKNFMTACNWKPCIIFWFGIVLFITFIDHWKTWKVLFRLLPMKSWNIEWKVWLDRSGEFQSNKFRFGEWLQTDFQNNENKNNTKCVSNSLLANELCTFCSLFQ